jgi:Protein of unknown function (DUF3489)
MNSSVKLTDTQLMVLSAASQREDRRVIMPDKLRGGAANKLLTTLTTKGMIELIAQREEVGSARGASLAGLTNYRISGLGLARIGVGEVEPVPATAGDAGQISGPCAERASPAVEDSAKSASRGDQGRDEEAADGESAPRASNVTAGYLTHSSDSARSDFPLSKTPAHDSEVGAAGSSNRPPRTGSKLDRVIVLLSSDTGATIDELIRLTGWLPHTARAALTGLRHRGYDVRLERGDKVRGSVYRVVFARAIAS